MSKKTEKDPVQALFEHEHHWLIHGPTLDFDRYGITRRICTICGDEQETDPETGNWYTPDPATKKAK